MTNRGAEAGKEAGVRAFVALPLPEAARPALERVRDELAGAGDVRWVPPENWHLTLKFLGNVERERLQRLAGELEQAANNCSTFVIELAGVGAFPNLRRPQVIWAGARQGAEPLRALAAGVDQACASLGFAAERRPFHAHLTLGRVRSPRGASELVRRLQAQPEAPLCSWEARELVLMGSTLAPTGATYDVLARFPLQITRATKD